MKEFFNQSADAGRTQDIPPSEQDRAELTSKDQSVEKEDVPEQMRQRRQKISDHLNNIYRAQHRLEALHTESITFKERNLLEGGFTAMQVLLGVLAIPSGMFLRDKIGHSLGAIVSYQGAQIASRGLLKFMLGIWPVSRERIEKRLKKKRKTPDVAAHEIVHEHSLRKKMAEITDATKERHKDFADYCKEYHAAKKFISPEDIAKAREKFLNGDENQKGYIAYIDELLKGQKDALENEQSPKGLIELSKTIKEYYQGLALPHRAHRESFGMLGAVSALFGSQALMKSPTSIAETFWALTSGLAFYCIEALEKKIGGQAAESYVETIGNEIESLRHRRLQAALRLERLVNKRLKSDEAAETHTTASAAPTEEKTTAEKAQSRQELTETEKQEIETILEQWRAEVARIARDAPLVMLSPQTLAATQPPSFQRFEHSALSGFLGVVLPKQDDQRHTEKIAQRRVERKAKTKTQEHPQVYFRPPVVGPPTPHDILGEIRKGTIQQ